MDRVLRTMTVRKIPDKEICGIVVLE
jgi:hypothetical protein